MDDDTMQARTVWIGKRGTSAKPERGTIRQVATCANCWRMLEKSPVDKRWYHVESGEVDC